MSEGVFRRGPVVGKRGGLTLPAGAVFADQRELSIGGSLPALEAR